MAQKRIESFIRFAEQHGILDDEDIQQLLQAASITENPAVENSVETVLGIKALQHEQYPFSRHQQFRDGISLGESFQGRTYSVSGNALTKHLLAIGQSGAGKTTLFYQLFDHLDEPVWVFDLKQDFRHLLRQRNDLLVLPWTELRFNPLQPPPGVPPRRWIQVFAEIFGHATALLSGSKNHLLKKLVELYQLYNLFDSVSYPFPSLHELELLVRNEPINYVRKQSNYRDTLLNRLEAMNLVAGTVFNCSTGYSIEDLLQRNVVFEFDGLSRDVQNFLMEILFAYVYEYRLAKNQRGGELRHAFFLDEGKRVFSVYKERQDASGIPEIDELTSKMREFGEGLVVADQEASKLTDSIKANTYTKVLLSTGDRKQFDAVVEAMNLSERQRRFAQNLGIGEAIVQSGNHDPVPVKLRDYTLDKEVTDDELENMQRKEWNELAHTRRDSTPRFEQAVTPGNHDGDEEREIVDDPDGEVSVSDDAHQLLKSIVEKPFKGLTERYERFSSRYRGNKAKDELVETGVVVERQVRTGNGSRKLLQLTEKGHEYAKNRLELDTKQRGRGGIVHQFWQHWIKEAYEERGETAELEVFNADVYLNTGDQEYAIEVAMGDNPREIEHVETHLQKDFQVCIACRDDKVRDGLRQRLAEKGLDHDRVEFRLLREISGDELPGL